MTLRDKQEDQARRRYRAIVREDYDEGVDEAGMFSAVVRREPDLDRNGDPLPITLRQGHA